MNNLFTKLGVAGITSVAVVESVNLEPLWSALITLAISIVSVLAIDGIGWLKGFIKKHTFKDDEDESNQHKGEDK